MRKAFLGGGPIILAAALVLAGAGCSQSRNGNDGAISAQDDQQGVSQEEMDFNASGRAKAVADESDLWPLRSYPEAGLQVGIPPEVSFDGEVGSQPFSLTIEVEPIGGLQGTMGYDEGTARKNVASLQSGQYGQPVDFSLEASRRVRAVDGDTNAQDFLVLGRFEVCSVMFERKAYFFSNGQQVVITLRGDADALAAAAPQFFTADEANCGQSAVWRFERQAEFYSDLAAGQAPPLVQEWYGLFDRIVGTVQISQVAAGLAAEPTLDGRWVSLDDEQSTMDFSGGVMAESYAGNRLGSSPYVLQDGRLSVTVDGEAMEYAVTELTADSLVMTYLPRGNTLRFRRADVADSE
jgi:hypothetical protein